MYLNSPIDCFFFKEKTKKISSSYYSDRAETSPAISLVLLYWLLRRKRTWLAVSWLQVARVSRFSDVLSTCTHVSRLCARVVGLISRVVLVLVLFFPSLFAGRLRFPLPGPATASGHVRTSPYPCGFRMAVPENFGERNRVFLVPVIQVFRSPFRRCTRVRWDEFLQIAD